MAKTERNKIEVSWGAGETDLFIAPCENEEDVMEILDYEYDHCQIHDRCGGKCYYISRSGNSGAGFIQRYGELTKVGYYRVDTVYLIKNPIEVADGIELMIPYATHTYDKDDILKNHPVVVRVGEDTIIYCDFYKNMAEVLDAVLSGEELQHKPCLLKRKFIDRLGWNYEREVEIKFYNLFGERSWYPWEFATELLENYSVETSSERLYNIFHISEFSNGRLVKYDCIGNALYATERFDEDPFVSIDTKDKVFKGWEIAETNMLYKCRKTDVYIVGWTLAKPAFEQEIERVARFLPSVEKEAFLTFMKEKAPQEKYVEYERNVPKLLFFQDKEKQLAIIRKNIAKKVRKDVVVLARQFAEKINDQKMLELIPDDLVIVFEDSLAAGNCRPGTQAFAEKHFPGQTQLTAGELKKHSDNSNVMRIFRYIAERDGFMGKEKLEIPA